jgi:hypothetical protein
MLPQRASLLVFRPDSRITMDTRRERGRFGVERRSGVLVGLPVFRGDWQHFRCQFRRQCAAAHWLTVHTAFRRTTSAAAPKRMSTALFSRWIPESSSATRRRGAVGACSLPCHRGPWTRTHSSARRAEARNGRLRVLVLQRVEQAPRQRAISPQMTPRVVVSLD